MNAIINTKKTGAGHYEVTIYNNDKEVTFETTDMQIIDDIHTMKNDGFEDELCHFDSFEEIQEWANNKLK
jgi:hypothetical protein